MARSNSPANTDAMSSEPVSINCSINDSIAVSCGCRILVLLGCYRENQNDGPPHRGACPSVGHTSDSSKRISRRHVTQPSRNRSSELARRDVDQHLVCLLYTSDA